MNFWGAAFLCVLRAKCREFLFYRDVILFTRAWTARTQGMASHCPPLFIPPWSPSMLEEFTNSRVPTVFFSAKTRFDQFCFGVLQVEFTGGPGPGQRFWFLPVPSSRGSAPLSLQPPSPPAAAPATAPRGRIPDFLQIKRLHIICFNRDTFERVSTD